MQTVENVINSRPPTFSPYQTSTLNPDKEFRNLWGNGVVDPTPLTKQYPSGEQTASNIPAWLRGFAGPDHLSDDPQERIDMNSQKLVANLHSAGKIFGQAIDEIRSLGSASIFLDNSGRMTLLDRTVSDRIADRIDQTFPEVVSPPNFHLVQLTSDIAVSLTVDTIAIPAFGHFFHVRPAPLTGRSLSLAQAHSQELQLLQRMNRPAYRSGFVTDKAAANLAQKSIVKIKPENSLIKLNTHLRQVQEYGEGGWRILGNGKIRYYGKLDSSKTPGKIMGRRMVREWDPQTGLKKTWHENIDHKGTVRIVRPETNDGIKTHYVFDEQGNFLGKR